MPFLLPLPSQSAFCLRWHIVILSQKYNCLQTLCHTSLQVVSDFYPSLVVLQRFCQLLRVWTHFTLVWIMYTFKILFYFSISPSSDQLVLCSGNICHLAASYTKDHINLALFLKYWTIVGKKKNKNLHPFCPCSLTLEIEEILQLSLKQLTK